MESKAGFFSWLKWFFGWRKLVQIFCVMNHVDVKGMPTPLPKCQPPPPKKNKAFNKALLEDDGG